MTGIDHEGSEQITIAAHWLVENWQEADPIFKVLKQRFGLDLADGAKVLAEANRIPHVIKRVLRDPNNMSPA